MLKLTGLSNAELPTFWNTNELDVKIGITNRLFMLPVTAIYDVSDAMYCDPQRVTTPNSTDE